MNRACQDLKQMPPSGRPRLVYRAPRLVVLGTVARLTRAAPPQKLRDGQYSAHSDAAWKEILGPVDADATLARLRSLPVLAWRYRDEAPGTVHFGPTAQGFRASFGLGDDERVIEPVDSSGVLMAAVQALAAEVAAQRAEIDRLTALVSGKERENPRT